MGAFITKSRDLASITGTQKKKSWKRRVRTWMSTYFKMQEYEEDEEGFGEDVNNVYLSSHKHQFFAATAPAENFNFMRSDVIFTA